MAANPAETYEIDVEDVEYLRHGDKWLLARMFKPRGQGPFPAVVELHGCAWCLGDRLMDKPIHEPLAKSGVVVASLDFRVPPAASYPGSFADINYGVRWLKAHASEFHARPDTVGIMGSSSGGHQAMLAAMRPNDPRYSEIRLPAGSPAVDARVHYVVMYWPVIDPLARYHYARKLKRAANHTRNLSTWCCRCTINTGRPKRRWPRATRCSRSNGARRSTSHPRCIFKAPLT